MRDPSMAAALGLDNSRSVRCRCGRTVPPDMCVELPHEAHQPPEFVCDACRELLFEVGAVTRVAFYTHHGASVSRLAKARHLDDTDRQRKAAAAQGGKHKQPTNQAGQP